MMLLKGLRRIFGIGSIVGCAVLGSGCSGSVETALENGFIFEQKGQLTEAMAEYNQAIEIAPNNMNGYHYRARLYQKQGNLEAALADFNHIIEIRPGYSDPYYGRGQIYEEQGRRDKAIDEYTRAIENNNSNTLAYFKRARIYQYKGEYQKALEDARKAQALGAAVTDDFLKQLEEDVAKEK